ncbi:MAG: hypothetical protein ACYDB9_08270 [Gammaproteobacteria bacterium]
MPNGHNLKPEELRRLEAPLRQLDVLLSEYAMQHNMKVRKNYHNMAERSLTWTEENQNWIMIRPAGLGNQACDIGICAIKDINGERYWKNEHLLKSRSVDDIKSNLFSYLDRAVAILRSWTRQDLVPSGVKAQIP